MRFIGRGHPAIRATHAKTLELAPGDELTERGTCIVAVSTETQPPRAMAGPVRIRIGAGACSAAIRAVANSSWDPSGPIVVRRSPLRLPGTFAIDADLAAADLPRDLVTVLQDPDVLVTVDVVAVPADVPTVVLFAADPSRPDDPRLAAEVDAADIVDRQDAGARSLVAAHLDEGIARGTGPRRLVVATSELPHLAAEYADMVVEVVGLPPQLAVGVASAGTGPMTLVPADELRESIRRLPAATRIASVTKPTDLPDVLAFSQDVRGSSRCIVAQPSGPLLRADLEHPPTLYGRDPVYVCFGSAERPDVLDPAVRAAIGGLLADGVPTKTAAAALATLTGMPRRAAYDAVLTF